MSAVRAAGILLSVAEFSFESGLTHTFHTCRYFQIHCKVYISQKGFQIVFVCFYHRKLFVEYFSTLLPTWAYPVTRGMGGISANVQYRWYTRVQEYYIHTGRPKKTYFQNQHPFASARKWPSDANGCCFRKCVFFGTPCSSKIDNHLREIDSLDDLVALPK